MGPPRRLARVAPGFLKTRKISYHDGERPAPIQQDFHKKLIPGRVCKLMEIA
jgi:hypothetical protein